MKNPRERFIIITILVALLFILFSTTIFSISDISLSARSAALYEPETKNFLYTKNADSRLPMASTTKIMTALVAIENCDLDKKIEVDDRAIGIEGSSLYLKHGEVLSMRDLLTGLMLRSANDAAAAIAYAISGGIDEFASKMNEKAYTLRLKDTHFTNPHGLDNDEHYTTAKELALIAAEAMKNETFKEIVSQKKEIIENSDGEARLVLNHNKLLTLYDGAIGIKTGFTKRSGRCLVGASERDGLTFITVTINAPDDWSDHKKLFDYGYSLLEMRNITSPGEFIYKIPILDSENEFLTVKNTDSLNLILRKDAPGIEAHVKLMKYAVAPIKKNDIVGKVIFTLEDKYIGEINLVAENDVYKKENNRFFSFLK